MIDAAVEGRGQLRRPDPRPADPAAGHLRQGADALMELLRSRSPSTSSPTGLLDRRRDPRRHLRRSSPSACSSTSATPGIVNFGQAGFMAIGAYSWRSSSRRRRLLVLALAAARDRRSRCSFGLLIGLPSLRLRADYFAIATIAFAEIDPRHRAERPRAHRRQPGHDLARARLRLDDSWDVDAPTGSRELARVGSAGAIRRPCSRCSSSSGSRWRSCSTFALSRLSRTPWGRVLRAIREDEDAARALGKNAFSYKLQSLAIAAALGALSGWFLALNLSSVEPGRVRAARSPSSATRS